MNILCINTCFQTSNVSLITDTTEFVARKESALQHSVVLMQQIESVLSEGKINAKELDYVCVAIGPGSFTGIRIGLAVAKGLCDANNKLIIPINTLDLLTYNTTIKPSFIAMKGITNEYFVADYNRGQTINCRLMQKQDFAKLLNGNDIVITCDDLTSEGFLARCDRIENFGMKDIALANIENAINPCEVQPLYLRLSQAELQRKNV